MELNAVQSVLGLGGRLYRLEFANVTAQIRKPRQIVHSVEACWRAVKTGVASRLAGILKEDGARARFCYDARAEESGTALFFDDTSKSV